MRRINLSLLLSGIAWLCFSSVAWAHGNPRIPVYVQEMADANGRLSPAYRNLEAMLTYLESQSGLQFERIRLPWERAKMMALEGQGLIWGFSKTRERLNQFDYSETVVPLPIWAVSYVPGSKVIRDVQDLRGAKVCTRRGVSLGLDYEKAKLNVFKADEELTNFSQMFHKLIAARCEYLFWGVQRFDSRAEIESYLHQQFIPALHDPALLNKKFTVSQQAVFYDTIHFATGRGYWQPELSRLNQAIRKGRQNGEIERILQRQN